MSDIIMDLGAKMTKEEMLSKPIFTILRSLLVPNFAYYGLLVDNKTIIPGIPFAITAENPDLYFPKGIYRCISDMYYSGDGVGGKEDYQTYKILVPGRDLIKFHKGNDAKKQSLGCPLIGEYFGELLGRAAIQDSKGGFDEFMRRAKEYNEFLLEVKEGIFS